MKIIWKRNWQNQEKMVLKIRNFEWVIWDKHKGRNKKESLVNGVQGVCR